MQPEQEEPACWSIPSGDFWTALFSHNTRKKAQEKNSTSSQKKINFCKEVEFFAVTL